MPAKDHWDRVYSTKESDAVSWFQEHAEQSLALIQAAGVSLGAAIVDVGAGASTLVDDLLAGGYTDISVLDLSAEALAVAQNRLGARSAQVSWLVGDITLIELPTHRFDLWHDRAVFHFLTTTEARAAYVRAVLKAVKPGGHVIVATFAEDGPTQCSGLPVMRYNETALHAEFGAEFALLLHQREVHQTPSGSAQSFVYCYCRKGVAVA